MVKIEDFSREEVLERERASKLVKLTSGVVRDSSINQTNIGIIISVKGLKDFPISISLLKNRINVYNPSYLDSAVDLAKRYEASGESEFTVKKNYE